MNKWYEKTVIIILLLIFFFPIGLFLMWKYANWGSKTKKVVTAVVCVLFIFGSISNRIKDTPNTVANKPVITSDSKTTDKENTSLNTTKEPINSKTDTANDNKIDTNTDTTIDIPEYEIINTEDTSYGSVIRQNLNIIAKNPDSLNDENFQAMCRKITTDFTSTTPVNALTLYFYNDINEIGHGYSVGMCTYFPDGDISKAQNVKTGDYSTFKYTYTFTPHDDSDTSKPTERELEIYDYYQSILYADYSYPEPSQQELTELYGEDVTPSNSNYNAYLTNYYELKHEEECNKQTAEKFGISLDEVDDIWIKVDMYKNP